MTILRQARRWALLLLAALLALVVVAGALLLAWSRFGLMEAEQGPLGQVVEDSGVSVTESSTSLILQPAGAGSSATGLVFYPGAKVEADAYAARLADLVTEQKMTVVIVKPWLHLALFDRRGLDTFTADLPEVGSWISWAGTPWAGCAPARSPGTPMPSCCWAPTARTISPRGCCPC